MQNTGWLPSYVSKRALERKVVRGLIAEIALPAGAALVQGKRRVDAGQLEGKRVQAHRRLVLARLQRDRRSRQGRMGRARASAGDAVDIVARHERAGTLRVAVTLA